MADFEERQKQYEVANAEFEKVVSKVAAQADIQTEQTLKDLRAGSLTLEQAIQKIAKVTDEQVKGLKEEIKLQAKLNDAIKLRDKNIRDLTRKELQTSGQSIPVAPQKTRMEKLVDMLAGGEKTKDSFEQMYRVRQRFSGIEQIFSGNLKSGITQVAGSFTSLARIMNGPYVAALTATISALNALDKQLTKVNIEALTATGGYMSPYMSATPAQVQQFHNRAAERLTDIGLRGQYENISSSLIQNFSTARRQRDWSNLVDAFGYGRKSFSSLGIDDATADRLMTALQKNENLNTNQSLVAIRRMQSRTIAADGLMSDKQIIDETMKGYDANKKFNLSMDWVNRQVVKFNSALEKGTRSMDDFAAIQKSFYGGDTGQLAGLANIIAESASMTGVEVPPELIQNLNNPDALKMLMSDPEVMKKLGPGLQATAKRFASESGNAGNALAEQGFLGDILKNLMNVNVSRQAVIDLQKSGYDFEKTGLLGTGGGISVSKRKQDQEQIDKDAELFRTNLTQYTEKTSTVLGIISQNVGEMKDAIIEGLKLDTERRIQEQQQNYQKINKPSSKMDFFIGVSQTMANVD